MSKVVVCQWVNLDLGEVDWQCQEKGELMIGRMYQGDLEIEKVVQVELVTGRVIQA